MKSKDWIVAALFFIFPFMVIAPGIIWKGQLLFFITMGSIIIAFQIKHILIKSFLLYAIAWQMFIFMQSFRTGENPGAGLSIILSLTAGAMVFKFVSSGSVKKETWYSVIRTVVIIQAVLGSLQHFGINLVTDFLVQFVPVRADLPTHITGTLGNRNFMAAFIAMSIPMFASWKWAEIKGVNVSVIFLLAVLVGCMSPGTLAAIIGIAIYYTYSRKIKHGFLYVLLSVVVAVGFAAGYILITGNHLNEFADFAIQWEQLQKTGDVLTDTSPGDIGRFAMWMLAGWQLAHNWFAFIFGFGPGAFWGRHYPLHGQYVSIWFQFGLVGMVLALGYIFTTLKWLWKSGDSVLLAAFAIICLDMAGNFPMEVASTAFLAIIIAGLIERDRLEKLPPKRSILEALYLHPDRTLMH